MTTVIEGDITGAYDNVNHKIMMNILKNKISDKKTLKLIETGLHCGLLEQRKAKHTIIGQRLFFLADRRLFFLRKNNCKSCQRLFFPSSVFS